MIDARRIVDELPLSYAQSRLWMLDRIRPGDPTYNIGLAFDVAGDVDASRLERALNAVVGAHEILRTTYPAEHGVPVQRIWKEFPVPLQRKSVDEAELEACLDAFTGAPFDLQCGPVARAALFELAGGGAVFVLVVHHIAADRWSLAVLLTDLSRAYATGATSRPAEDRAQYADFTLWQTGRIEPHVDELVEQARRDLADVDPILELPTDFPRPEVASHAAGRVRATLDRATWEAIEAFARRAEATPFAVLLSVYGCLLARLCGQSAFAIGAVMANRDHPELEDVVGICVNTLPVRYDAAPRSLVEQVRATRVAQAAALDRAHLPFELLVDRLYQSRDLGRLDPSRDLGRTPVVQAVFNMLNVDERPLELAGVEVTPREEPLHGTSFDLTLYARPCAQGLELEAVYAADLFRHERAEILFDQFERLLRGALAAPDAPLASLPLHPSGGRPGLPDPREPQSAEYRGPITGCVARWAREAPDRVAVTGAAGTLTYAELAARGAAVAAALREAGVARGDVVAILPTRDTSCAVAVLGTLWVGAAAAVLDPDDPPARLRDLAAASGARVLACCNMTHELVGGGGVGTVVDVEHCASRLDGAAAAPEPEPVGPDDLAVVGFTSGTTAGSKVVRGRHGSLTHFTPWMADVLGLSAADRFSVLSGLSHDPLQRELFTPWFLGGSVDVPTVDELLDPDALAARLRDREVTVVHITPPLARHLGRAAVRLPSVRQVLIFGDVVRAADVGVVAAMMPLARVVAIYGATESQRAAAWTDLDPADPPAVAPLGVGMPDVQLLVLGEAGLADVGELGEVAIRSPHLALGYADRAQTEERFMVNPSTSEEGDRLYRTGDFGRFRLDGSVDWSGRQDRIVKIRGHRVDPREVEAALIDCPHLREAAVVPTGAPDNRQLVAFLSLDRPENGGPQLLEQLRAMLPQYMVPSRLVVRETLPLTPNFKVDYRALALAAVELEPAPAQATARPLRTPLERALGRVWSDVLDIPVEDRAADLFELGGHSLAASRIAAVCHRQLGLDVSVVQVLRNPTIELLVAAIIASAQPAEAVTAS